MASPDQSGGFQMAESDEFDGISSECLDELITSDIFETCITAGNGFNL